MKKAARAGNPIELKIYDGVHHSFDDPSLGSPRQRWAFGFAVIDQ